MVLAEPGTASYGRTRYRQRMKRSPNIRPYTPFSTSGRVILNPGLLSSPLKLIEITGPGRSSVPAVTSPSRTRGSSSSRRSRTPFPTTMPASILRRRTGRSFCSATCSPTLSALRQPWIWRPSTRSSTACPRGLRCRAPIGVNARGAQAPSEKTSRRGYSSASVNKAACQCGIRGYCLSK